MVQMNTHRTSMDSQYTSQFRSDGADNEAHIIQTRPPSRRTSARIGRGEDEDVTLTFQPNFRGRQNSARTYRTVNGVNISSAVPASSPPRPPGSSITTRSNLSTGLMRPDQISRGSLVIKAMKEKLASQRGGIRVTNSRTASSRGQVNRNVQDKRYFMGMLHLKIGELTDEIDRLNILYNEALVEHGNSLVYEKRVKELAAEITEMQGTLIDLNIVADNMTFDNVQTINSETQELRENNDSMIERIESIFSDRLRKEELVSEVEKKLAQERHRNERLLSEMGPEMSEMNNNLLLSLKKLDKWQQEIEALNKKKNTLNEHIYMFPVTYEAIRLEGKCLDLKKKLKNIKRKVSKRTADEERKYIMDHVVNDNSQINIMESAINEINKEIKNAEEILSMTKEPEEGRDNRQMMYNELLKKEEVIENYLSNFETSKQSLNEKLKSIEDELLYTLKQLSNKLAFIPTAADYLYLQMNQSTEQVDVLNTAKSIGTKCENLRQYLMKVEIMQTKLSEEEEAIENKIKTINEELEEYNTCIKLKKNIEHKEQELLKIKLEVEQKKEQIKEGLEVAKTLHNDLMKQLNENEHQLQIFSLEKKFSNIAQNNFLMSDLIEEIKVSTNVKEHRNQAIDILQNLNIFLRNNINI